MVKKTKQEKPVEIGLDVDYHVYCDVTREANPEDSWSRDSTHTSYSINDVVIKNECPDVTACFPVAVGDIVYLVYLVYSTGDSFGQDDDGRINFIDVFLTKEKADAAAAAIVEHSDWYKRRNRSWEPLTKQQRKELDKKYKSEYTVGYVRENGEEHEIHAGWNGYFESLSYVNVESFTVKSKKTIQRW